MHFTKLRTSSAALYIACGCCSGLEIQETRHI